MTAVTGVVPSGLMTAVRPLGVLGGPINEDHTYEYHNNERGFAMTSQWVFSQCRQVLTWCMYVCISELRMYQ